MDQQSKMIVFGLGIALLIGGLAAITAIMSKRTQRASYRNRGIKDNREALKEEKL
ncbi:MAG TPA: hypothetical protein VKA91_09830 [Nitrososphaeraceae archaeon]|nr:hypothetical protein [Nitrososphaeraceae archaeon]